MADSTNGSSSGSSQKQFRVIGTRPIRHDGIEKVTGRAKYGADYSFPGMLYGKVLRSPHAARPATRDSHREGRCAPRSEGDNHRRRPARNSRHHRDDG